jgi:rubrerythrin
MHKLYQAKHELWLSVLFTSFAIDDKQIKRDLYDFSTILFRHMKWIGETIVQNGSDYDYDRTQTLPKFTNIFEALNYLKKLLDQTASFYTTSVLEERIKTDETYMQNYIDTLLKDVTNNHTINAFNMQRKYGTKDLSTEQTDALTVFLFEESYKEYELILIYAYMQARTQKLLHFNVFQDLIDESYFHLQSFGEMMAKIGILALPRELHPMSYKITDIEKFIKNGIAEEEAAKEMCRELSGAIQDEELSKFFDFINYQESYHIELMKKLL